MIVTAEISCYPLTTDYSRVVDEFIRALRNYSDLKVQTSHSSTLVIGEMDSLLSALQSCMTESFTKNGKSSFVMKILSGDLTKTVDLSPYAD